MILAIALFLGSAVVICFSFEYFFNSIEWVGLMFVLNRKKRGGILLSVSPPPSA